jgi:hypothetical protein
VPTWTRRFVYGFLAVLVVCGLAGIEAWPFSGFKLFSALRDDERVSWQIMGVDRAGDESTIVLSELPVAYRNTTTLLREFDDMSPDERDEVCEAWSRPRRERGEPLVRVRIYRKTTILGAETPPPERQLMWECAA